MILIEMSDNAKDYAAMCYNVKGELLGKLPVLEVSKESGWFSLSDGVVTFSGNKTYRYYSPDFEPLF